MDTLTPGGQLQLNQTLQSNNGEHTLVMQPDGDLVLYEGWPTSPSSIWASSTEWLPAGLRPTYAEMQVDGNLVLYNASRQPAWATGTDNHPGAKVTLQDDRNLVIHDAAGQPIWASNTAINPRATVLTQHKEDTVGDGKKISTDVTMYANGLLVVDSYCQNANWVGGLRPRILVVVRDSQGRAVYLTRPIALPTLCSVPDMSCASNRRSNYTEQWDEVVAQYATRLDIYQADNANFVDLYNKTLTLIKELGDIADALKKAIGKLTPL